MKVYTLPDGSTVKGEDQFQINNQKYPSFWLISATDDEISKAGITVNILPDPVYPVAPILLTPLQFRQLFTTIEKLEITTAAMTNAAIRIFMDDESSTPTVNLSDPEVTAGIAALVSANLLTQDRADQILKGITYVAVAP